MAVAVHPNTVQYSTFAVHPNTVQYSTVAVHPNTVQYSTVAVHPNNHLVCGTIFTLTFKHKILIIYQNVLFPAGQDEISTSPVFHVESEN